MNEIIKNHLEQYDAILDSCCFDLYSNQLKSKLPLDESYYLKISKGAIWVLSTSLSGFYYGIQTLVQIIEHTLFQMENLENYIILPTLTVVDFPDMNYRGISVDLNSFTPSFKALSDLIPFIVKCRLNNIVTIHDSRFPYTDEENKKFRDLCKFHHIHLSHLSNLEELKHQKLNTIQFQMDTRFVLPDYKLSLDIIEKSCESSNEEFEGVLITTPHNRNCPLDLQKPLFPIISDMFWNSKIPVTKKKWVYVMGGAHLNLFEDSLHKGIFDFRKMAQCSSSFFQEGKEQIDERITILDTLFFDFSDLRKRVYENSHLLDALEWGFRTWELELKIVTIKKSLGDDDGNKIPENVISILKDYSESFKELIRQSVKLFETTNHIKKGDCQNYFSSQKSTLKTLVETWILDILKK